jgi:hypothetical protein
MRKLLGITAIATIALAIPFTAPAAQASGSTTTCAGTLDPGTYHRVVVPQNAVCLSDGPVRILAGVWVQPGATFELGSDENPSAAGFTPPIPRVSTSTARRSTAASGSTAAADRSVLRSTSPGTRSRTTRSTGP